MEYYYEGKDARNIYGANVLRITAYSQNDDGNFEKMTDNKKSEYFIKIMFESGFFSKRNAIIVDSHWMNAIKL